MFQTFDQVLQGGHQETAFARLSPSSHPSWSYCHFLSCPPRFLPLTASARPPPRESVLFALPLPLSFSSYQSTFDLHFESFLQTLQAFASFVFGSYPLFASSANLSSRNQNYLQGLHYQ